jgi:hypothetical protein
MIRINLLKEPQGKPKRHGHGVRNVVIVLAAAVAAGAVGYGAWKYAPALLSKKAPDQQLVVKKESAPSTYNQPLVVEDVVREVSDSRQKLSVSGLLSLPYDELSFAEKVGYEALFARNVVELLGRTVPGGIGLRSLETDNFQTVYAVGLSGSKDLIQSMLSAMKNEGITMLPPPYSFVKPNDARSFKFAVTCKVEFGLNLADSVVDAPLPSNDALASVVKKFEQCARENAITFTKQPAHVSTEKVGSYYRHSYQWSGTGSYKNFVRMVVRLYEMKMICAFKRISLVAQSGSAVKIDSHIILTTRQ